MFGPPQFMLVYLKKDKWSKDVWNDAYKKEHIKQSSTNKFKFLYQQYIQ